MVAMVVLADIYMLVCTCEGDATLDAYCLDALCSVCWQNLLRGLFFNNSCATAMTRGNAIPQWIHWDINL
jgi:hypothetical protein